MSEKNTWFGKPIYRYEFEPTRNGYGRYSCVTTWRTYEDIKKQYFGMFPGITCNIRVRCNNELIELIEYRPNKGRKLIFDTTLQVTYRNIKEMAENMLWTHQQCRDAIRKKFRFKYVEKTTFENV